MAASSCFACRAATSCLDLRLLPGAAAAAAPAGAGGSAGGLGDEVEVEDGRRPEESRAAAPLEEGRGLAAAEKLPCRGWTPPSRALDGASALRDGACRKVPAATCKTRRDTMQTAISHLLRAS